MPRAALFALLVASLLEGSLQAQRATAGFHGGSAARSSARSGFVGHHGLPNRFLSSRSHFGHDRFGSVFLPYFFPYDEPIEYDQPMAAAVENPAAIPQSDARQSRTPEPPPPKAQVIEIQSAPNSTAAKMLPPTIFILTSGERLETRRYVLTESRVSVTIDRRQHTIPLDKLDINATITANQERGIDLFIPTDRNEISVSF
jgi:hypothetical protein